MATKTLNEQIAERLREIADEVESGRSEVVKDGVPTWLQITAAAQNLMAMLKARSESER